MRRRRNADEVARLLREADRDHVEHRDDCEAKYWLDPVWLKHSHGFARKESYKIQEIIEENQQHLLDS